MTTLTQTKSTSEQKVISSIWQSIRLGKIRLPGIVGIALVLRALVAIFCFAGVANPDRNFGDFGGEMGWVARSITLGHGFSSPFYPSTGPTALMPPLYPYLLAGVFHVFGLYTRESAFAILLIDSLFSALTCIPVYLCVKHAVDQRTARLAAWLWALYPLSIYYSGAWVWDYALTSCLFAFSFYFAQRLHLQNRLWAWFGFGAFYGIAAFSNPSVLSVFPFLLLLALWKVRRVGGPWLRRGAVAVLALVFVTTPWSIRNERAMHASVPMRDGFWLEFWAGNHGDTSDSNPPSSHPATNPVEMQKWESMGEIAYLESKHGMAVDYVSHHPVAFVVTSARRALRFWTGIWSFAPDYLRSQPFELPGIFFCTVVTAFMLLGVRRWAKEDFNHFLPYLLLLIFFPITYYLTHASMDYRQPIEPEVIILVAVGLVGFRNVDSENDEDDEGDAEVYDAALQEAAF